MPNIYNFLKTAFATIKSDLKTNPFILLLALALITLPLPYIYNSIAVILFVAFSIIKAKKENFVLQKHTLLFMLVYVLMLLSLLWTIDSKLTQSALSKTISILIIPVCFAFQPIKNELQKTKVLLYFGNAMVFYGVFCFVKAIIKYYKSGNSSVFFYHELVTFDVNAIHVSLFCAIAIFSFVLNKEKTSFAWIKIVLLLGFIVLLSSKNILIITLLLLFILAIKAKIKFTKKVKLAVFFTAIVFLVAFFGIFKNRIQQEFKGETSNNRDDLGIEYATVSDAWNREKFTENYFFSGTALRVYQARIFTEFLSEDLNPFTGYGLNATDSKIMSKAIEHNLYQEYGTYNFHNQYIQIFAEIGIFGFLLLVMLLVLSLKNAITYKDFLLFSFTVLMISLFLTESFLSRQRGIVFFTIMYCLLNNYSKNNIKA